MPDFDTGHLFLTYLIPIKDGAPEGSNTSYDQRLRTELAELPPAHQTPATSKTKYNSPFARNTRNHLARMFVLNDVVFNGRVPQNPLVSTARGIDTINPDPVDRLNCAYLVFTADVDAIENDGDPLPSELTPTQQRRARHAYAAELWETMNAEIKAIFSNCVAFEDVTDAASFGKYLDRCRVETTMPFHDYYLELPKFNVLPLKALLAGVAIPLVITVLALIARILGLTDVFGINTLLLALLAGVIFAAAGYFAIQFMESNGNKPLPPAKYDDLPSVLKALYNQQVFTEFAADVQGKSDAELHAAFADYLSTHQPSDRSGPTQQPGVISSAYNAS